MERELSSAYHVDTFPTQNYLKEGNPFSPFLFVLAVDYATERAKKTRHD
jgi:hypothetical protein